MSLLLWLYGPNLWHWTDEDSFEHKDLNSKSRKHGLNPGKVWRDIASGSQFRTDSRIIVWHEVKKGTVPSTHACCGEHAVCYLSLSLGSELWSASKGHHPGKDLGEGPWLSLEGTTGPRCKEGAGWPVPQPSLLSPLFSLSWPVHGWTALEAKCKVPQSKFPQMEGKGRVGRGAHRLEEWKAGAGPSDILAKLTLNNKL